MPLRSEWLVLYGAVAVLYLFVAWREWLSLEKEAAKSPVWHGPVLALAIGVHGFLLVHGVYVEGQLRFGFAHALSATLWITVIIVWFESFLSASRGLFLLVLPLAAITTLLPIAYPGAILGQATDAPMFRVHLFLAILAYSLLTIAAMQALLMASMDRRLHGDVSPGGGRLAHFLDRLPPLLSMETVLFRLIGAGFLLLTATLVSGIFFSEELFGRALRFDHKTVFTFAAWFVFGALLLGRIVFGWRGRTALRWTLTGFAMLMLAYVGSRFVLEVLLQRA